MANENPRKSIEEKYKDKLTPVAYAKKEIADFAISVGSMVAGGFIGNTIGNRLKKPGAVPDKDSVFGNVEKIYPKISVWGALIGSMLGGMVGGIIQGYSRWKKHESERLAVSEINEDVANMKIRYRTDPELLRENERLREMLAEEEKKTEALKQQKEERTLAGKIAEEGPRSPLERPQISAGAAL